MRKLTTEEYINKAIKVHDKKYDYSKTNYINADTYLQIICPNHGTFEQRADHHLQGHGCKKCMGEMARERITSNITEFIENANKVHNFFYNYEKSIYKNAKEVLTITCPKHGEFEQTPDNHLHKHGCPNCGEAVSKNINHKKFLTYKETFVDKAKKIQVEDIYDYSQVQYKGYKVPVKIICPKHGEFLQTPENHLMGKRCKLCNAISKSEILISKLLIENNISFNYQKTFDDCRNPETDRLFRYDFYIPDKNTIVEYDGRQHFQPIEKWGGKEAFEKCKTNDTLKSEYCKNKNIKLIRINNHHKIKEILLLEKII